MHRPLFGQHAGRVEIGPAQRRFFERPGVEDGHVPADAPQDHGAIGRDPVDLLASRRAALAPDAVIPVLGPDAPTPSRSRTKRSSASSASATEPVAAQIEPLAAQPDVQQMDMGIPEPGRGEEPRPARGRHPG